MIPQFEIRNARIEDAQAIAEIYNEAISERVATFETLRRSEEEMRKWIDEHDEKHPILVASIASGENRIVVAWASISSYRTRACYSGVGEFSIYVKNGFRGKGVGRFLLNSLVQSAMEKGYWKLISRIFTFNQPSRELCKKCGFREVGIYEKHGKLDGKWLDTVIVERLITENIV